MKIKQFQNILLSQIILLCSLEIQGQPLKILPLGNSLTKGVYCNNGHIAGCVNIPDSEVTGFRYQLYLSLNTSGYDFEYVGNELAGWTIFPTIELARHAGYPGITSSQLATKLNENSNYLLTLTAPDVILLEVGTNDILGSSTSIEGVRSVLNEIDEFEISSGKPVLVFLSKVIRFTQGTINANLVPTFNSNLLTLYNQRKSSGDLIEWVDAGANLVDRFEPLGDMKDELHPNQAGYNKMAQQWFLAIDNYNTTPVPTQIPDQVTTEGSSFAAISLDNYIYDAEDADAQITWTVQPEPQNLTVTINGSREAIIGINDPNWCSSENVTFIATDRGKSIPGLKKSVSITVAFTADPVNDPPVVLSQTRIPTTVEETPVAIFIADLQVQDIDNPQGDLTLQILSGSNYTFSGNTITPGLDFNGELAVNVRVNDLQSSSQVFSFKINVSPKNDIPVIVSANNLIFNEDTPFQIKLSDLNVSDPDNFFPADFTLIIGNGQHYTYSGNTITPAPNYNGILQVPVMVRDLLDQSNEFLLSITIIPVNDPPFITIPVNRTAYAGEYFEIQIAPGDVDIGDILITSVSQLPSWLAFNSTTYLLSGTPDNQHIGNNTIKITVTDQQYTIDSLVTIFVTPSSGTGNDDIENGSFLIYPNPADEYIVIRSKKVTPHNLSFRLISATGNTVLETKLYSTEMTLYLDRTSISPGVYFYEIMDKYDLSRGKIIINPRYGDH